MKYVHRVLEIEKNLKERSLFLFGPRQTGKSAFIKNELIKKADLYYSLLDQGLYLRLLSDPTFIRKEAAAKNLKKGFIIIDEIQKNPSLLDEVHFMIEEYGFRFLLTGSSARKLRSSGTNLLGGRARTRAFHPFVYPEIKDHPNFSLEHIFKTGLLPPHFLSSPHNNAVEEDLSAYVNTYLKEEIAAEGLARNLSGFARFLEVAAISNSNIINYSNIANDAHVPRQTVKLWFDILYDTLIAFELPVFRKTIKRKSIETSKLYLFDIGVTKTLRKLPQVAVESSDFGIFFEQYIFMELRAYIDYKKPQAELFYWRSQTGCEVDFILDSKIAIEVKSTTQIQDKHLKGLKAMQEEKLLERYIIISRDESYQKEKGIERMPWKLFLEKLWAGEIIA